MMYKRRSPTPQEYSLLGIELLYLWNALPQCRRQDLQNIVRSKMQLPFYLSDNPLIHSFTKSSIHSFFYSSSLFSTDPFIYLPILALELCKTASMQPMKLLIMGSVHSILGDVDTAEQVNESKLFWSTVKRPYYEFPKEKEDLFILKRLAMKYKIYSKNVTI